MESTADLDGDGEVAGFLARMLLTDPRRPAGTRSDGALVPMAEQDRSRWNADSIAENVCLITATLPHGTPYQLQAAIAALHDEAPNAEATDWSQIGALYGRLMPITDNPMVALNRTVAVAMARVPQAGLALLDGLAADQRIVGDHRLDAVRGHLLEMVGDSGAARDAYRTAAERATNMAPQRYLPSRADDLADQP